MRFVGCKTTSGYEAMILTPDQHMPSSETCENSSVLLRFLARWHRSSYF